MENSSNVRTGNINALWLQNIYENIKNLEQYERITREGCSNIFEYLQLPRDTIKLIFGDIQFRNIRFIVTELHLLLGDLTPVLSEEKLKNYRETLDKIENMLERRELFIKETHSALTNSITSSTPTTFFYQTLKFLGAMKIEILKDISHILYVKDNQEMW